MNEHFNDQQRNDSKKPLKVPQKVVYEDKTVVKNHETGEIVESTERRVTRKEKTDDFVMLFTSKLQVLQGLTKGESDVLNCILRKYMGKNNLITLTSATKQSIADETGSSYETVHQQVNRLCKKNVIIRTKMTRGFEYRGNFELFGKGNWDEIKMLRQEFAFEYDFENNQLVEYTKSAALYNGMPAPENTKIIDAKEVVNGTVKKQEILIDDTAEEYIVDSRTPNLFDLEDETETQLKDLLNQIDPTKLAGILAEALKKD